MTRSGLAALLTLLLLVPAAPLMAAPPDEQPVAIAVVRATTTGLRVERRVAPSRSQAHDLLRDLRRRSDVVAADFDVPIRAVGVDPLRANQWGLTRLQAESAWQIEDATGQVVAVLDTGVD
ncbi:MAG: hypothetical protein M3276_05010, partial [Actinomycetota bacterium]|nr:hypothetical protein [Actinomycetota bacterium]